MEKLENTDFIFNMEKDLQISEEILSKYLQTSIGEKWPSCV